MENKGGDRIFGALMDEWRGIHRKRLNELVRLGVFGSLMSHVSLDNGTIPVQGVSIKSDFQGDPIVRIRVVRSKNNDDVFYAEEINIAYDGQILTIAGAEITFNSEIPQGRKKMRRQVGEGFRKAFNRPERKVDANFNPRNYY